MYFGLKDVITLLQDQHFPLFTYLVCFICRHTQWDPPSEEDESEDEEEDSNSEESESSDTPTYDEPKIVSVKYSRKKVCIVYYRFKRRIKKVLYIINFPSFDIVMGFKV